MDELKQALKNIQNACGLDEIPGEVWKLRDFHKILLDFCSNVYNQDPIQRWTEGCLLHFQKKEKELQRHYIDFNIRKNI